MVNSSPAQEFWSSIANPISALPVVEVTAPERKEIGDEATFLDDKQLARLDTPAKTTFPVEIGQKLRQLQSNGTPLLPIQDIQFFGQRQAINEFRDKPHPFPPEGDIKDGNQMRVIERLASHEEFFQPPFL